MFNFFIKFQFLVPNQQSFIDYVLKEKRKTNPKIEAKDIDPEEMLKYYE